MSEDLSILTGLKIVVERFLFVSSVRILCAMDDKKILMDNHYETIYEPVGIDRSSCRVFFHCPDPTQRYNYICRVITVRV